MSMIGSGGEMLPDIEVARYALRTFKRIPDLDIMGPVAIAQWVENFGLYGSSTGLARAWKDGTCTAVCAKKMLANSHGISTWMDLPKYHTTPHLKCSCGIYGCLTLEHLAFQYPTHVKSMVAVIAAEGTTILGDNGLRTQYARVVAWWVGATAPKGFTRLCRKQFEGAREFTNISPMLTEYGLNGGSKELELRPGYPIMKINKE